MKRYILIYIRVYAYLLFLVTAVHWLAMTTWILAQSSSMCSSRVEKLLFSVVVGVVYCFNFISLIEGRACVRFFAFYSLCLAENVAMMMVWFFVYSADVPTPVRIAILCTSLGVFLFGE